jgi:hypothetical protein
MFFGRYITPVLRRKTPANAAVFEEWVEDWAWDSWLEREFKYTAGSITKEMRKRWVG